MRLRPWPGPMTRGPWLAGGWPMGGLGGGHTHATLAGCVGSGVSNTDQTPHTTTALPGVLTPYVRKLYLKLSGYVMYFPFLLYACFVSLPFKSSI